MNARVTEPGPGEAIPVTLEKSDLIAKTAPAAAAAEPAAAPAAAPKKKRSGKRLALMVSVPVVLAAVGGYFFLSGGRYVETDNAYVQQPKVAISADVAGRVISVAVHDNEAVTAGQVLFAIDPEPYQIALDQANAALASARVNVEQLRVAYGTAGAQLEAAKSTLAIRQEEFDRKSTLTQQGLSANASLDDAKLALQTAHTQVSLAEQQQAGAAAALAGNPDIAIDEHPAVRTAQAAVAAAERNLAKATVIAPADGIVSQVASLNVGQFVATGTTIASLIETTSTWIEANFKETQLAGITPGMPVEIKIDAYPGVAFEGKLESIGAATGAQFALIPAQNATGNWVKVTQRVPVRIEVTGAGDKPLRAGMSAVVAVDTKPAG
ncbi:MAG TPA: HlyD family secretion protein [Devosia sp.]|nr:HlyD family secretion protein [Devosia sp.]